MFLEGEVVVGVGLGVNLKGIEVYLLIVAVLRRKVEAEGEITITGISELFLARLDHRVFPAFASGNSNEAIDFGIALHFS